MKRHRPNLLHNWLIGGSLLLIGIPVQAQNVNDATQPNSGVTNLFDSSNGFTIDKLIRATENLNNRAPSPEEQNKSLDATINRFNQARQLKIGPRILAPGQKVPTPDPLPPTPQP